MNNAIDTSHNVIPSPDPEGLRQSAQWRIDSHYRQQVQFVINNEVNITQLDAKRTSREQFMKPEAMSSLHLQWIKKLLNVPLSSVNTQEHMMVP